MATKKTTTATKIAAAKKTSAKKPAAKKQPAPEARKATTAKNPTATKRTDKKMSQIDAALAVLKKARKPMSCKEMVEAMATVIEEITLYWTYGGPRKWRFQRGTIRLGGGLCLLASSTIKTKGDTGRLAAC